jgi:hypothetical protein
MNGFKQIFDIGQEAFNIYLKDHTEDELFSSFRLHPSIYGFIHNGDSPPDLEAIKIAMAISPELYNLYIARNKNKKILGYGNSNAKYKVYDNLESRHIMLNVILWNTVKEPVNSVVEIGGGFGNWRRLNPDIQHWTILDLPYVAKLQDWYLGQHDLTCDRTVPDQIDLVIGTHSLSEFDWNTFVEYYYSTVIKSKYLFYAYHKFSAGEELINKKLEMIQKDFDLIVTIPSEDENCANNVYQRKPLNPTEMFSD